MGTPWDTSGGGVDQPGQAMIQQVSEHGQARAEGGNTVSEPVRIADQKRSVQTYEPRYDSDRGQTAPMDPKSFLHGDKRDRNRDKSQSHMHPFLGFEGSHQGRQQGRCKGQGKTVDQAAEADDSPGRIQACLVKSRLVKSCLGKSCLGKSRTGTVHDMKPHGPVMARVLVG